MNTKVEKIMGGRRRKPLVRDFGMRPFDLWSDEDTVVPLMPDELTPVERNARLHKINIALGIAVLVALIWIGVVAL